MRVKCVYGEFADVDKEKREEDATDEIDGGCGVLFVFQKRQGFEGKGGKRRQTAAKTGFQKSCCARRYFDTVCHGACNDANDKRTEQVYSKRFPRKNGGRGKRHEGNEPAQYGAQCAAKAHRD